MVWNIRALLLHKIQLLVLVNSRTKQLGAAVSWTSKPLRVVVQSQAYVRPSCNKQSHYFVHKACDWE